MKDEKYYGLKFNDIRLMSEQSHNNFKTSKATAKDFSHDERRHHCSIDSNDDNVV